MRDEQMTEYAVIDSRTGEKRPDHTHLRCADGPDPWKGHDHYCDMVEEGCDEWTCFGSLPDGSMDLRDEEFLRET